jgi:hypothetical protein
MNKTMFSGLLLVLFTSAQDCKTNPEKQNPCEGKWYVEFNSSDVGLVRTIINFEFDDSTFVAFTRKNADRDILGYWTSFLGRLFTKDFENGSLLNITHGKALSRGDTTILSGILQSAIGNYYFNGKMIRGDLTAELTTRSKAKKGTFTGNRKIPSTPFGNYPDIIDKTLQLRNENIFNRSVLNTKESNDFDKKIKKIAADMQDDLEMEFAFFYYAGKLPFSHFSLMRLPPEERNAEEKPVKQVSLEEKSQETVYLKIMSFGGTALEMDSVFSIILDKNYKNLIVDLRGNPGGSVEAGMKFAKYVTDSAFYGGVFLTQKWFEKHQNIPNTNEYSKLPHFSEANFDLIIKGIHQQEGLCLEIIPEIHSFTGNLFILTNSGTASTCEPIVYGLKKQKRAIIVGEKTAGAMLNGEFFIVDDGFSLVLPTADYYASDGYHIDRKGVEPTIEVKDSDPLKYTMSTLIKK